MAFAKELCIRSLESGKPVVTANKALLAEHGNELAALAEKHNAQLAYEAAVAGGIPIIKALREGLAGNAISRVYGILNGTCKLYPHRDGGDGRRIRRDSQGRTRAWLCRGRSRFRY